MQIPRRSFLMLAAGLFWLATAPGTLAAANDTAANPSTAGGEETFRIQSTHDDDIKLFVRRVSPSAKNDRHKAVLFVHGASYPSTTFATPVAGGPSWMARMAQAGYTAYALDIRGYGRSTRPDVMQQPAEENEPFARADVAVNDIDDVVNHIRKQASVDKLDIVGWSWGTVTSGLYATEHGDKIDRLVLYAPVYSTLNKAWTDKLADADEPNELGDIGAYRTITREGANQRWAAQITADDPTAWRDPAVFDAWYDAMLATEPGENAEAIKAPNGVLVDIWEIFHERPVYDASEIDVPTLVIRGDDDPTSSNADALGLFHALGSDTKRYVVIGDATHFVALEKNAPQLFAETALFLAGDR